MSPIEDSKFIRKQALLGVKRLVVKVGTSLTWDTERAFSPRHLKHIVREIGDLQRRGIEVVLVSSGAIGAGMTRMGMKERPVSIPDKQATAAVGQIHLMDLYEGLFADIRMNAAQILLTRQDLESGQRYFNARNTLEALINRGVVPIVNENDTVTIDELKFGDNDKLAAQVTNLVQADLLIILTDVDGMHEKDPRKNPGAARLSVVDKITKTLMKKAGGQGSLASTGGMYTKLEAARLVTQEGEHMLISDGRRKGVLKALLSGEDLGTLFTAKATKAGTKQRWMPFTTSEKVGVKVGLPAQRRINMGGVSLASSDITDVVGKFDAGWVIRLMDSRGRTWGKGVCRLGASQCRRLKGKKKTSRLLVHHDDLVLKRDL